MIRVDALVAGAGPAGNLAAFELARAGLSVLLVEKERLPRPKTCGGGLSRKTLDALPYAVDPVVERVMRGAVIALGPGRAFVRDLDGVGVMTCRERLDAFMAGRAVEAGATLRDGCRVEDVELQPGGVRARLGDEPVFARALVAADGAYSAIRRRLMPGARPQLVPAIEALVTPRAEPDLFLCRALFDFGALAGGYGWIFPKAGHLNVGLYRFHKTPESVDLKRELARWIERQPVLREPKHVEYQAHSIPVRPAARSLVAGCVLFTGDAGGLGEALYGEGIYYAVKSGMLAAQAVVCALSGRGRFADYDRALAPLVRDLAASRAAARLIYQLPAAVREALIRDRRVNGWFAGVVTGRVSPLRCLLLTALRAPLVPLGPRYALEKGSQ